MSQKQICDVTLAALAKWADTFTSKSFSCWVVDEKNSGRYWGADETFDEAPHAF